MMTAPTDVELLTAYAHKGEEQAFREFVQRHATWVLGVATRSAGQVALAEEIAQAVFCLAAQKAAAAWLESAPAIDENERTKLRSALK